MRITHKLRMDLARCGCRSVVPAVQGEANTRVLEVALYDNGVAWEPKDGTTAAVAFQKPDGTKGLYDKLPNGDAATVIAGSTVTATLAPQALTCAGTVLASIVFYDADMDTLATFPFTIKVEANPAAGEQISNNYYYLQNMEQVNKAYAEILQRLQSMTGGIAGAVQSVWVGKKFVAFGTSITAECASYNGGYLDVIANRNGFTEYLNAGTSGKAMANNTKNGPGINDKIHETDIADYDLVVIECCTNDFKLNVPLGSVGQVGDADFDADTFCGALRDGIEYILTADPTKHIMLIADPHRNNAGYDVNHTNTAGHKLIDYVNAMQSVAELYGLPVCDWYRHSGINALTLSLYTYDGLHPNADGYKVLGNVAAAEIANMYSTFIYRFADVPSGGGDNTPPATNTWVEVATTYTSGAYIAADGTEGEFNNNASSGNWIVSDFIAVSEGDLFRYAGVTQPITNANVAQSVCGYDANKSFVSIIIPNGSYAAGQEFTIPAGVAYIRCGFYIKDTAYSLKKYNA